MPKSLTLTIDNSHELEILTDTHAYLEDNTQATCRPWSHADIDAEQALTPQIKHELIQIIKEAEALYDRAKAVLG